MTEIKTTNAQLATDDVWLYMRVSYGREKKIQEYLESKGIEVFRPTTEKETVVAGVKKQNICSLIPNVLFVHSTIHKMKDFVGKYPTECLHHFYEPYRDEQGHVIGAGRRPIVIPDNQMQSFQIWTKSINENKIFLDTTTFAFKTNDIVRVIEGEFKGFTGHVVRIKGQNRVGIIVDGIGFISTAYIPKGMLEIVNLSSNYQ